MGCLTFWSPIVDVLSLSHTSSSTTSSYRASQPVPRRVPLRKRCYAVEALPSSQISRYRSQRPENLKIGASAYKGLLN